MTKQARIASDKIATKSHCPLCGYGPLDGLNEINIGDQKHMDEVTGRRPDPKAGDLTMCCDCGEMLMFTNDLRTGGLGLVKAPADKVERLKKEKGYVFSFYQGLRNNSMARRFPRDGMVRFSALFAEIDLHRLKNPDPMFV